MISDPVSRRPFPTKGTGLSSYRVSLAGTAVAAVALVVLAGCSRPDDAATPTPDVAIVTPAIEATVGSRSTPTVGSEPTPSDEAPVVELDATATPNAMPSSVGEPTPTEAPGTEMAGTVVPVETGTPGPRPVRGGVLRLTTQADIAHQDVHFEVSPALSTWGPGIAYSRLLRFRSGPDVPLPNLGVVCDLCESWRAVDPVSFEFNLRDDVRWHDDALVGGRALTSEDVVYSLTRQLGGPNGPLLGAIDDMALVSDRVLTIRLAEPDADFMLGLADARSKIVAREAVELSGDLRKGPTVGTGPWRLTSTGGSGAHRFERFPDYFETDRPYAEALQVHVVEDPQTRDAAFIVGQIDVMELTPFEWDALRGRMPGANASLVPETGSGVEFALNPDRAPFDDLDVRRAAFAAMNPAQALQDVWLGAGYLSFGFPLSGPGWGLEATDLIGRFVSPAEARRLLSGIDLEPVTIRVGRFGDAYLEHAERIASELRSVGFDVDVEDVSRVTFGDEIWKGGDYQAFLGPIPPVTSPNAFLFTVVHSNGPYYRGGPQDEELDILIELQAGEYDADVRRARHKEIQRRMLASAVRYMPVTRTSVWAVQPWVKGFYPNLAGLEYAHWASVWLER